MWISGRMPSLHVRPWVHCLIMRLPQHQVGSRGWSHYSTQEKNHLYFLGYCAGTRTKTPWVQQCSVSVLESLLTLHVGYHTVFKRRAPCLCKSTSLEFASRAAGSHLSSPDVLRPRSLPVQSPVGLRLLHC